MTKVKICGLSRLEDIDIVNSALPDYIGFVFAPSRRRIDEITANTLKQRLDPRIKAVGVFVNQDIETIANLHNLGIIDLIQLHGDEDMNYITKLKKSCRCHIIKAVGIKDTLPLYPGNADYLLFDTLSKHRGGTGKTFDWRLLNDFSGPPFFLAGGLITRNVLEAVKNIAPYCVDVSSGVEANGTKDADMIHEFIRIVRQS